MGLPVAQVREAQRYYQANRALIEQEATAEKARLQAAGISLGPVHSASNGSSSTATDAEFISRLVCQTRSSALVINAF